MLKRLFGAGEAAAPNTAPEPRAPLFSLADQATVPAAAAAPDVPDAPPLALPDPFGPRDPLTPETSGQKRGWWARLRQGLARSSSALGQGIGGIFTKRKLDAGMLEDLEDILVQADLGVGTASRIVATLAKGRFDRSVEPAEVRAVLADEVEAVLAPVARPLICDFDKKPYVILVVGVNGSGKTTTIGKIAATYRDQARSVMLAAGDTFRAAAIEQLKIWADRTGAGFVARGQGSDAASLAYEAIRQARDEHYELLIVDTAGRLQNRAELPPN